jgi:hypothetical protein
VNLVAGNASGTTLRTVRLRELVTVKEEIVTATPMSASADANTPSSTTLTSILVSQIQCGGIFDSASGCAHLRSFQRRLPHHTRFCRFRGAETARSYDAIERY